MRIKVTLFCPFHRDLSWITEDVIEDYASAIISGGDAPSYCIAKWSGGDQLRGNMLPELLSNNPEFRILQDELIAEFGIEHFIGKPRDKVYHIRQLEIAIDSAKTAMERAALYKELREYQGWSSKPSEKVADITINNNNNNGNEQIVFDNTNPIENERVVQSIFAAVNARSV